MFGIFTEPQCKRKIVKTPFGEPTSIPILGIDEIPKEIISKGRGYYQMKVGEKVTPDVIREAILKSQYINYLMTTLGQEGFPYKDIKIELTDILPTPDPYLICGRHLYTLIFEDS